MCTLYRGISIDASYHVSVHLAKRFQRRFISLIDHSEELHVVVMFAVSDW
jgi:hypothetical protein